MFQDRCAIRVRVRADRERKNPASEWLDGNEYDNRREDEHGRFIEPAVKDMAARVLVGGKLFDQMAAIQVIARQQEYQRSLGVQPAAGETVAEPQPETENDRQRADRRDEAV